jgi:alkanesulfonate monooxygenase SsuD/methylene tetrahydromethanopterin reductase-like flavin-dependent oxidoreductase (luciferase family)
MDVGIGLPNAIPGTAGKELAEWAQSAEDCGFSSLGVIDRIVYPNYEPLIALATAAGATERIRLVTSILIGPLRTNTALLAKQALSVDRLAGGRLVLGIAVGGREDDFEASGIPFQGRGKRLDEQLDEMKRIWEGEERGIAGAIGPPAHNGGPRVIVGGQVEASFRRAARHGEGWIMGGGSPDQFAEGRAKTKEAWAAEGRDGDPRTMALAYFSLGDNAEENADSYLHHYYEFLGEIADQIASSAATDEETVKGYVGAFDQAGCDELILFPCASDPEQVGLLADALDM